MSAARHPPRPIFTAVAAGGSLTAAVLVAGVVAVAAIGTPPALPAFLSGGEMTVQLAAGSSERPAVPAGGVRVPFATAEFPRSDGGRPLTNDVPAREVRAGRRPATAREGARHVRSGARARSTPSTPGNTPAPVTTPPVATPAAGAPAPAADAAPAAATVESTMRARAKTNPGPRKAPEAHARPQAAGGGRHAGAPVTSAAAPAGSAGAQSGKPAAHPDRADRVAGHDDAPEPRPRRAATGRPHDQPAPAASAPPQAAAAAPQEHGPGDSGGQATGNGRDHDRGGPANGRDHR
jgi:hypothetical protein